jgi:hypoxanthine phosphoribosyltransferase
VVDKSEDGLSHVRIPGDDFILHFLLVENVGCAKFYPVLHQHFVDFENFDPKVYIQKEHGRKNLIEGELPVASRVLVVEDLISTGGSVLKAIDALKDEKAEIAGVLAIFQYGFAKADEAFAARNIHFKTLTHYDILVEEAVKSGYIATEDQETLKQWRQNPDGWGALYA